MPEKLLTLQRTCITGSGVLLESVKKLRGSYEIKKIRVVSLTANCRQWTFHGDDYEGFYSLFHTFN